MRLIDGDALRDKLQCLAYDDWNQGIITFWAEACNEIADMVADMPTIEPDEYTVSRQAAIDALMEFDKKLRKINWYQYPYVEHECRGVDEAIVKIANLPSAQPEIIRCKECVYFFDDLFHCDRVTWYNEKDDFCSKAKRRTYE